MTGFVVVAAAMLVVALGFLLVPLLSRRSAAVAIDRDASNVVLLREQLRELDADLAAGEGYLVVVSRPACGLLSAP